VHRKNSCLTLVTLHFWLSGRSCRHARHEQASHVHDGLDDGPHLQGNPKHRHPEIRKFLFCNDLFNRLDSKSSAFNQVLVMPGYDSIDKLAGLETSLNALGAAFMYEIFMQVRIISAVLLRLASFARLTMHLHADKGPLRSTTPASTLESPPMPTTRLPRLPAPSTSGSRS
jgi:hypothetical protein